MTLVNLSPHSPSSYHQKRERIRQNAWTRTGLVGGRRGCGSKLRRYQVDVVCLGNKDGGACSARGFHVLQHGVLLGRILMNQSQGAITIRAERYLVIGIEAGCVDPATNGQASN